MRVSPALFLLASLAFVPASAQDQKQLKLPSTMLSAKLVYFDDKTGVPAVGAKALNRLKKWGRFHIVSDHREADLLILLSAEPYKGGNIIFAGGQTGAVDKNGNITEDPIPTFNKLAPIRYAYLTVIDQKNGEKLWDDSRQWGGLLTGFNSTGENLVKKLEKRYKK